MKKIVVLIVILCIVFSFQSSAFAATDSTEYGIDELHMKISISNDYIVVTRDTKELPKEIESMGLTLEGLQAGFIKQNVYLDAVSSDYSSEFDIVGIKNNGVYDFQSSSDADINKSVQQIFDQLNDGQNTGNATAQTKSNIKYNSFDTVHYKDITFVRINADVTNPDTQSTTGSIAYITVKNGLMVTLAMNSLTGPVTNAQKTQLDSIAKTAQFESIPQPTQYRQSNQAQGIDWTQVFVRPLVYVIITAVIGGISGFAAYLSKKRRNKKAKNDQNII